MTTPPDHFIRVRGAREHNLRNVDVAAPRDALVVFTGVSGSGKSSLAFGTIYGEAQRRYLESVAPYARRLIEQAGAPRVDDITGLPPAIALQQRRGTPTARSSVGTVTQLSNSLRMLFSRAGDYPAGLGRLDSDAFSPNTVAGACPECHGLGRVITVTEQTLVPDPTLTIRERAIAAWPGAWQGKNYRDILTELGYDVDLPWADLPQEQRDWILFTEEQPVVTVHPVREATRIQRPYEGTYQSAKSYVLHTYANTQSATMRKRVTQFLLFTPCPVCHGKRLQPASLSVSFAGRDITELASLALTELASVLEPSLAAGETAATLVRDLIGRVTGLSELGLGYLSIDRATPTLSSGELQRLRLATQLRSGLFGVLYVLDEPSAGLHPADTAALLTSLHRLRSDGNSVFLVEHNLELIRDADWLVDVGPGAGEHGGQILHSGPVEDLRAVADSATADYLFSRIRSDRRTVRNATSFLELHNVRRHNLAGVDLAVPLGLFTVVTGVSGSGKSTLISQVLAEVVASHLHVERDDDEPPVDLPGPGTSGLDRVTRLVQVDQKPIGRTPRSNLATYTGLFDAVRKVFAETPAARERVYSIGRFSFNVPGGRCENCQGEGFISVELLFLPGTYSPCPVCHGARYNPETLEITYRGLTIAEVLELTVENAAEFLADVPAATRSLRALLDVGLGYLRLGQPATTLSGGEAQRIKLASELQRAGRGHALYLLDEPTTGLHPADVTLLMGQLHAIVDAGNTVVVVEHDMAVAATADWVIDLGPGGGARGGQIVAAGPPREVAAGAGATAPYLAAELPREPMG